MRGSSTNFHQTLDVFVEFFHTKVHEHMKVPLVGDICCFFESTNLVEMTLAEIDESQQLFLHSFV